MLMDCVYLLILRSKEMFSRFCSRLFMCIYTSWNIFICSISFFLFTLLSLVWFRNLSFHNFYCSWLVASGTKDRVWKRENKQVSMLFDNCSANVRKLTFSVALFTPFVGWPMYTGEEVGEGHGGLMPSDFATLQVEFHFFYFLLFVQQARRLLSR